MTKQNGLTDPRQIAELANAIDACEKSPLAPQCIEELGDVGDPVQDLRKEVRSIKGELPQFLLKSSAKELSELTTRLNTCAEYAKKVTQLNTEIQNALRIMSEFDQQVSDLGSHVQSMAAEAEYR